MFRLIMSLSAHVMNGQGRMGRRGGHHFHVSKLVPNGPAEQTRQIEIEDMLIKGVRFPQPAQGRCCCMRRP